ncbi:uncharacterized protein PV07_01787 [Cladophialophora immunda]|uniref:Clr5 domain-containing protein n=1 Tax=Cladophialophora immunda TaxID=569365 RepID=A0A0D2BBZ8_9EURO|nr:uncharacterized protein PV07_01787 [Cladophialophora immunda]KIW35067.1 hypothetical protein PV07_01787 [Cladophialophora immunda]OQV03194.1 Tetratricopeptide repeat-containing protein [Cladophialophora immunda]
MTSPARFGTKDEEPFVATDALQSAMSVHGLTPPSRPAYPPSLADWEDYKPIIHKLYAQEGRSLSEVQRTLCQKYHFRASCRSYKNKLRSWGIRKYYRAGTPQSNPPGILFDPNTALISTFNSEFSAGRIKTEDDGQFITGSPSRISSFPRDGFALPAAFDHKSPALRQGTQQELVKRLRDVPSSVPSFFIKHAIDDPAESIVLATDAFVRSFADSPPPPTPTDAPIKQIKPFRRRKNYIWHQFQHGLNLLEQGDVRTAFADFQRGCAMAEEYLLRPSKYALVSLLLVMGNRRWERHQQVWESVLRFMSSMSAKALGSQHPLAHIMRRIMDWDLMRGVAQTSLTVMLDLNQRKLGPAHPDVLLLQQSQSVELMRQGDFERSESLVQDSCRVSRQVYGPSSPATRNCLRRLGNLYLEQQRWDDAESVFENILALDSAANAYRGPGDESSVFTCQNLSLVNCRRGDLAKSHYWAQQELDLALKIYGPEDEYYADCVRRRAARLNGEPPQKWFSWLEVS